jgi:hypothetical protein
MENNIKSGKNNNILPSLPLVSPKQRTSLVESLLLIIEEQQTVVVAQTSRIRALEDEIARLKKINTRPKIKPSSLDKEKDGKDSSDNAGDDQKTTSKKRPGSKKKKKNLTIHNERIIHPDYIPTGSRFLGYQDYYVQDIVIKLNNTRYRLGRWHTSNGQNIIGKLPEFVKGHFGHVLKSYIIHQYHHQHVTQPLLWEKLRSWNIDISTGHLNNIIIENKEMFHQEKDALLSTGLSVSKYIHVDDTGARHKGRNGYCTHIGNELFAWFQSTGSKSRVNFLELLRASKTDYIVNEEALEYMKSKGLPKDKLALFQVSANKFASKKQWKKHLTSLKITKGQHIRIATEGALIGSVLHHGFPADLVIVSDDAGQFNVFLHALCWIHAERGINRLLPLNDEHAGAIQWALDQLWNFYASLKAYKEAPSEKTKYEIMKQFDAFCHTNTCFESLNKALARLHKNRSELLVVLERPDIPLHNNLSERDIREYVRRRKISGSTRSDEGRRCRDTFASLKKTCTKLGVSFWDYLLDRVSSDNNISPLSDIIRQKAAEYG